MKLSSKVAMAVAAIMAAGSAMAQITPLDGDSDVFAVVQTSTKSVAVDLGINITSFNFATTQTFTLDGSLTQLTSDLGAAASAFDVVAGNQNSLNNYAGEYFISTGVKATGLVSSNVNSAALLIGNYTANNLGDTGITAAATYASATGANNDFWSGTNSDDPGLPLGLNAQNFGTAPGTASSWYKYLAVNPDVGSTAASVSTLQGTWGFNAATDVLTYTAPSAVPLPAALWLMLSGLGGLGVVARRRGNAILGAALA